MGIFVNENLVPMLFTWKFYILLKSFCILLGRTNLLSESGNFIVSHAPIRFLLFFIFISFFVRDLVVAYALSVCRVVSCRVCTNLIACAALCYCCCANDVVNIKLNGYYFLGTNCWIENEVELFLLILFFLFMVFRFFFLFSLFFGIFYFCLGRQLWRLLLWEMTVIEFWGTNEGFCISFMPNNVIG